MLHFTRATTVPTLSGAVTGVMTVLSGDGFGSLFLRGGSQYRMYDAGDVASLLTQTGSFTLHLTDVFAKGAQARFSAVDKLFFPPCGLHVLPVVLTSRQPTPPHVTAHTSPYGGGGRAW